MQLLNFPISNDLVPALYRVSERNRNVLTVLEFPNQSKSVDFDLLNKGPAARVTFLGVSLITCIPEAAVTTKLDKSWTYGPIGASRCYKWRPI